MDYQFSKSNHYKTIENFLDSRKDFIVLGLCGKTGSGCTAAAEILQMSFDQLNLPDPGDCVGDDIDAHEYRILHTYAKVHWRPFYRIKSSALITAHILEKEEHDFLSFLDSLFTTEIHKDIKEALKTVTSNFFENEMQFCLNEEFVLDPNDAEIAYTWFLKDEKPQNNGAEVKFTPNTHATLIPQGMDPTRQAEYMMQLNQELSIPFKYDQESISVFIKTNDLYKIYKEYQRRRTVKMSFDNPLLICLLQKFIYDYLPTRSTALWANLARIEHGLEIIAQQQLGNNLRISGTPYNSEFDPKAYSTIVVDINHSIKLLNTYLAWRKTWEKELNLSEHNKIRRSIVVIDSIKNPFESMYLKDRYTNYYLLGIYTEDNIRHRRLLEKQRFPKTHIEAIDIIEQLSEFKKQWKKVDKILGKFNPPNQEKINSFIQQIRELDKIYPNLSELCRSKLHIFNVEYAHFSTLEFRVPNDYISILRCAQEVLKSFADGEKKLKLNILCEEILVETVNTAEDIPEFEEISPIVLNLIRTIRQQRLFDELSFILQNVESCLQNADIFINNEQDSERRILLKKKLLRYVSLIMNPGLVLPSNVERCMQLAYTAKLNSGCISRQVGAVITDDKYHLLSIGWNQQPEGQIPCAYRDLCSLYYRWSSEAYSDFECDGQEQIQEKIKAPVTKLLDTSECPLSVQGKLPIYCFKDLYNSLTNSNNQVHPRSLHAEETAFLNLGQYSAEDGILFTTSSPCELCAKKAKYKGIKTIYYIEPYPGLSFKHVLNIGPISSRPKMLLFTGAIGRAYTQLYTPLLPQKDEVEFWLGAKLDVRILDNITAKGAKSSICESNQHHRK